MIIDAKAEPRAGAQSADPPPIYSGPPPSRPAEGSQSSYRSQPPSHPDLVRQGPDRSVPMMVSRPDDAELGMRYHHQLLAQCAQGNHVGNRHYGVMGIIAAIFLFPCGLVCLVVDSEKTCSRCGEHLD